MVGARKAERNWCFAPAQNRFCRVGAFRWRGFSGARHLGPHPLLNGSAERLAARGSWSRLTSSRFDLLDRSWTPIADLRRRIAIRFQDLAGRERGGLLAALVLGSAQVQLPSDLRQMFRVAGLSHALAASGFHLSVLIGAALMLSRRWTAPFRLALAFLATLLFLLLAGPSLLLCGRC